MSDSGLTYMRPDEFARLGERCFGRGWQEAFARFVGYNRHGINRFAVGKRPIPPAVALAMLGAAEKLDNGRPVTYLAPAGEITDSGFKPLTESRADSVC